jgi:hypothetical protein
MTPYKYVIKCKKCQKPMTIVELYFTRGLKILFWVVCVKCSVDEEREADFLEIQSEIVKTEETTILTGNDTVN